MQKTSITFLCVLCVLTFAACGEEQIKKGTEMDKKSQTIYLKSKVSDQEMPITLPNCLVANISNYQKTSEGKISGTGIDMQVERLAFSSPNFSANLQCADEQTSKGMDIHAIDPITEEEEGLLKTDSFKYLLYEAKSVGSIYLNSKNNMDLYKVSPYRDAIFVKRSFFNNKRPLSINFIRFDGSKNDSFRYYFAIETILKGEYRLQYTVVANARDSSQFAEKLRNLLEQDKNVLDYPEVIAGFVENNERIAGFFENQQVVR